jgi:hypothetical protein
MSYLSWLCLLALVLVAILVMVRTWRLPREKRKRYVLRQAGLFLLFYLGVLVMLMWLERHLVFHPYRFPDNWQAPSDMALEQIEFPTADGNRIHAFWCPKPNAPWVVLYNHGNAGHIAGRVPLVQSWQQHLGASVLIYDYPEFGRSTGTPTEASCYAAGQAAYEWLQKEQKVPPEKLILYGKSLGCAVATELAMHNPHRALMLMAPFTNIPDIAQAMFPIFPARYIVRTKFDNAAKLARYRGVLLIGHGTADPVIPYAHGQLLHDTALQTYQKKFLLFDGWGHYGPPESYYQEAIALLEATQKYGVVQPLEK